MTATKTSLAGLFATILKPFIEAVQAEIAVYRGVRSKLQPAPEPVLTVAAPVVVEAGQETTPEPRIEAVAPFVVAKRVRSRKPAPKPVRVAKIAKKKPATMAAAKQVTVKPSKPAAKPKPVPKKTATEKPKCKAKLA